MIFQKGFPGISDPYNLYNDSDIRVAKADFLKLKMVALSYSVPQNVCGFPTYFQYAGAVSGDEFVHDCR